MLLADAAVKFITIDGKRQSTDHESGGCYNRRRVSRPLRKRPGIDPRELSSRAHPANDHMGELKGTFGLEVARLAEGRAGAQILIRRLPLGLRRAYFPKGPLGDWLPALLPALDDLCRRRQEFMLKIEPHEANGIDESAEWRALELRRSLHTVQPRQTLIIDMRGDGLWGTYRFKQGFGGSFARPPDILDQIHQPDLCRLDQLHTKLSLERCM